MSRPDAVQLCWAGALLGGYTWPTKDGPLSRVFYELYESQTALDRHEAGNHTKRFHAELDQYVGSRRSIWQRGVGQYWLADPSDRTLDVFENGQHGWIVLARVDDATPEATVVVRGHGSVTVTLSDMFGR